MTVLRHFSYSAALIPRIAALGALLSTAEPAAADDDAQVWLSMTATKRLSDSFDAVVDMNSRHYDNAAHHGHFQVRGLIGWKPDDDGLLGAGYSYVWSRSLSGTAVREHRIFQQASYGIRNIGKAEISGRTRLEQRWFSNQDGATWRLRQQIRLNLPLQGPKGLKAILHTEGYMLLSTPAGGGDEGVNQFRSFAGLGIPMGRHLSLEAGYLNQSIVAGTDRMNHALSLGLGAKF
jgi:hypothetical protein